MSFSEYFMSTPEVRTGDARAVPPEWTCPDCCVRPCNCKITGECSQEPDVGKPSSPTPQTEREAFEKGAQLEGLSIARHRNAHGDYDCDDTQWRWLGFKHGLLLARSQQTPVSEPTHTREELVESVKESLMYAQINFYRSGSIDTKLLEKQAEAALDALIACGALKVRG